MRILCVFPRYAPSLATFHHAYALMDGVRALMPPQGVLVISAYMPQAWEVRLVDENVRPVSRSELAWADAVFGSGMHIQRGEISAMARRARGLGKTTVLGGPSVSASPEDYSEFDYPIIKRMGDAVLLIFNDVGDAIPFVSQLSNSIVRNQSSRIKTLQLRISLHIGAVLMEPRSYGGEILGPAVNITARLYTLARARLYTLARPDQLIVSHTSVNYLPPDQRSLGGGFGSSSMSRINASVASPSSPR